MSGYHQVAKVKNIPQKPNKSNKETKKKQPQKKGNKPIPSNKSKKTVRKSKPQEESNEPKSSSKSNKIALVGIIVGSIIGIIGIIVTIIITTKPVFYIESSTVLRTNQKIIIRAGNWKADQDKDLDVKFDGYKFRKAGKRIEKVDNSRQRWEFDLKWNSRKLHEELKSKLLHPGKHSIAFAFEGKESIETQNIYFTPDKEVISSGSAGASVAPLILIFLAAVVGVFLLAIIIMRRPERKVKPDEVKSGEVKPPKRPKIRLPDKEK